MPSEEHPDTPRTEGTAKKIFSHGLDRLKTQFNEIMESVAELPAKNISRKIALLALTAGVLNVAAEKPAFAAAELENTLATHSPSATESINSQKKTAADTTAASSQSVTESADQQPKMKTLETHPHGYRYTKQKELFNRLFLDKEIVIPLIEKQGLILTQTSIEARNQIVHFDELKNRAYTLTALIRAVDKDTLELQVYTSDGMEDIVRFRHGNIISAIETKSE